LAIKKSSVMLSLSATQMKFNGVENPKQMYVDFWSLLYLVVLYFATGSHVHTITNTSTHIHVQCPDKDVDW